MATFRAKRLRRQQIKFEGASMEDYPYRMQLYKTPPEEEVSLETFEQYAIDRLKLLREIENLNIRFKRGTDDYNSKFREKLKEFSPFDYKSSEDQNANILADRRKDHISHFILRLAFSRTEDLRRWFLMQEMDLFRFRFMDEHTEHRKGFLSSAGMEFAKVSEEEKNDLIEELAESTFNKSSNDIRSIEFYKVPFTEVLDLVRSRKIFLKQGFACVHEEDLISIILSTFRAKLSQQLTIMSRKLPYLEEDSRLLPILKNLSTAYIGESYSTKKEGKDENKLVLSEIDEASKSSFPLCMRNLHEGIRKEHHLKHWARLQYGLFLKGTGLTLEEAMMFWRMEFTKKMEIDKFDKQYAYNVRHMYGKEGKRSNYNPYNCMKIIMNNQPGPGDHHGCPFKHSDPQILQQRLKAYNCHHSAIDEIVELVRHQHFQIACAKYFEVTHKLPENSNVHIEHPNQYFDESRKILLGGVANSGFKPVPATIKVENTSIMDTSQTVDPVMDFPVAEEDITMDEDIQLEV